MNHILPNMLFLKKNPIEKINKFTRFLRNVKPYRALPLVKSYCAKQHQAKKILFDTSDASKLILYSLININLKNIY